MFRRGLLGIVFLFSCAIPALCLGANEPRSGKVELEPRRLLALGFAWNITGDDNRNARVQVDYRPVGESAWHRGLDLARTQNEEMFLRGAYNLTLPNQFAGSVFDLKENT